MTNFSHFFFLSLVLSQGFDMFQSNKNECKWIVWTRQRFSEIPPTRKYEKIIRNMPLLLKNVLCPAVRKSEALYKHTHFSVLAKVGLMKILTRCESCQSEARLPADRLCKIHRLCKILIKTQARNTILRTVAVLKSLAKKKLHLRLTIECAAHTLSKNTHAAKYI